MTSRKDKIFQILKEKNTIENRPKSNEDKWKIKSEAKKRKIYETTADMLHLFDGGRWEEFTENLDNSFRAIGQQHLKRQKRPENITTKKKLCGKGDQKFGDQGSLHDASDELVDSPKEDNEEEMMADPLYQESPTDNNKICFQPINYFQTPCQSSDEHFQSKISPILELTIQELNGTPIETLYAILNQDNDSKSENTLRPEKLTTKKKLFGKVDKKIFEQGSLRDASDVDSPKEDSEEEIMAEPLYEESPTQNKKRPENITTKKKLCGKGDQKFGDQGSLHDASDELVDSPKEDNEEEMMADPLYQESPTDNNKGSQRKSRTHNCLYCDTLVTNFRRHLLRNHMMEEEVRAIFSENSDNLKERKRKRRMMLDNLRKKGNYKFNSKKGVYGENIILPTRRPTTSTDVFCREKYVSCIYCYGTFSRKTFYRHLKKCDKNQKNKVPADENENQDSLPRKAVLKDNSINLMTCNNDQLKTKIVDIIKKDKFGLIALNDSLITAIGLQFISNHREKKDEYSLTKKMRDAAKLLHFCQENSGTAEIKQYSDLMHPSKFQLVMKGVQHLSKLNSETGMVEVVGMPARLSYVIIEGAKILLNNAIQNDQISRSKKDEIKTNIHEFLELFRNSYKYYISTNAENTRKKQNATKPVIMPDDDDIATVMSLVKTKEKSLFQKFSKNVQPAIYENLCKAVICDLLLFNRRRPGELVRAELFNYCNRPHNELLTEDVLAVMSQDEINSLSMFSVFMVPGKNGRTVPILFTEDIKNIIDLLISCRSQLKIPIENRLLFPKVFSQNTFDGSKILREFTQMCTLKRPEHMTATGLRHHLATKTSLAGKESLTENICEQLGHTLTIHKKNYRFPIQAIQRGVVANHLLNVNGVKKAFQSTAISGSDKVTSSPLPASSSMTTTTNNDVTIERQEVDQLEKTLNEDEDWPANLSVEDEMASSSSDEEVLKMPIKHKKWSYEEKALVIKSFSTFITLKTTPGKLRCEDLIRKNPILRGRTWQQVNAVIYNVNTNKLKVPDSLKIIK